MMLTDVEIAQSAKMKPIVEIAQKVGLDEDDLELYGKYKAKISLEAIKKLDQNEDGKLILVTAINPTPAGEGKTTTMIGLSQALNKLGKKSVVAMREPSLGPCFGIKGGAAGGGYAQVVPMEDINLHFTGDIHAITAANNLIAAMLDNSIHQGNPLNIDVRQIVWKRVVDLNDRALRHTVCGLGGKVNGVPREDGFDITVASEVMAILCLATSLEDLKQRAAKMIVAYTYDGKPVTVDDIEATGAVTLLLKDAIKPNLVQTLDHTPVFVHGGPFANIAHGCNSVMATQLAIKLGDYAITEAGFGADLGAEKFLDIKCRQANLNPEAVVIVATVRALKMHGGVAKKDLGNENLEALKAGLGNLEKHIENIQETFKKSSLEGKAKVYILKNVEKTTKEAMNALLKILEEPTEGIYAIFTTKNINRILPTIISRCQVIELKPDNKEVLKEKLISKGYEKEKASILSYIIKDEEELEAIDQDTFDDIVLQAINFIEDLFLYRENLIINTQIHMLKDHKEKDNIKLFINLIILALKDMFHVKQNEKVVFCDHVEFFNSLKYDNNDIIKKIELLLETLYLLDTNANIPLLMDSMMYRI